MASLFVEGPYVSVTAQQITVTAIVASVFLESNMLLTEAFRAMDTLALENKIQHTSLDSHSLRSRGQVCITRLYHRS